MIRALISYLRELIGLNEATLPPGYAGLHCACRNCHTLTQPWDFDYIEVVDPYGNHRIVCTACRNYLTSTAGWRQYA